jgi:hypothetical protein
VPPADAAADGPKVRVTGDRVRLHRAVCRGQARRRDAAIPIPRPLRRASPLPSPARMPADPASDRRRGTEAMAAGRGSAGSRTMPAVGQRLAAPLRQGVAVGVGVAVGSGVRVGAGVLHAMRVAVGSGVLVGESLVVDGGVSVGGGVELEPGVLPGRCQRIIVQSYCNANLIHST